MIPGNSNRRGAHAQSSWIDRVEILETGIFRAEIVKSIDDPSLAAGKRNMVTDVTTPTDPISLRMVTRFPSQGLRNPAGTETHYRNDYVSARVIGEETTRTYTFEAPWEAVPGIWTFEIWQGNRKLAEQSFNVYVP